MRKPPCLLALPFLLAACGGPERAPGQPIPGVDMAHGEGANPNDFRGAGTTTPFLGNLVEEVAAATNGEAGVVAIFPALTYDASRKTTTVTGLGEHLASETASALLEAGASVLSGSDLANALRSASVPPASYASVSDAVSIAGQLKAAYAVTGRVDHEVLDLGKREEALAIDWVCRRVTDGQIVGRYRDRLAGGPLAETLMKYHRKGSEWADMAAR